MTDGGNFFNFVVVEKPKAKQTSKTPRKPITQPKIETIEPIKNPIAGLPFDQLPDDPEQYEIWLRQMFRDTLAQYSRADQITQHVAQAREDLEAEFNSSYGHLLSEEGKLRKHLSSTENVVRELLIFARRRTGQMSFMDERLMTRELKRIAEYDTAELSEKIMELFPNNVRIIPARMAEAIDLIRVHAAHLLEPDWKAVEKEVLNTTVGDLGEAAEHPDNGDWLGYRKTQIPEVPMRVEFYISPALNADKVYGFIETETNQDE